MWHGLIFLPVNPTRHSEAESKYPLTIQTVSSPPGMYSWIIRLGLVGSSAWSSQSSTCTGVCKMYIFLPVRSHNFCESIAFNMMGNFAPIRKSLTSEHDRGNLHL